MVNFFFFFGGGGGGGKKGVQVGVLVFFFITEFSCRREERS